MNNIVQPYPTKITGEQSGKLCHREVACLGSFSKSPCLVHQECPYFTLSSIKQIPITDWSTPVSNYLGCAGVALTRWLKKSFKKLVA